MKKRSILSLIKYYAEKNDVGFRNEAYEIAKEFDMDPIPFLITEILAVS